MKCRDCLNELEGRCSTKNVMINITKNRRCPTFLQKQEVQLERTEIESSYVPYNLRTRKAMKEYLRDKAASDEAVMTPDCLSNFRSSASA
jgi:hypothetical protein